MVNQKDLAANSLFSQINEAEREKVAAISNRIEYRKDTPIISQDDIGKDLYIIHKGTVKVSRLIRAGQEQILAELKDGDYFGFLSFIDGKKHSASVFCATDAVIFVIRREDFEQFTKENPELAIKILTLLNLSICHFLRQMISRLNDLIEYVLSGVKI